MRQLGKPCKNGRGYAENEKNGNARNLVSQKSVYVYSSNQ